MGLDVEQIREDFPILKQEVRGKQIVYFDNAATSQRPIQVINAIKKYNEELNSNVHRGHHYLSKKSTELYEEAHEIVAKHINADSWQEIIFSLNTSYAVNLMAYPLVMRGLKEGRDKIVITEMEHHSNMLPWRNAAKIFGARVEYARVDKDGYIDVKRLINKLDEKTSVLAITHASNVTGIINPIENISKEAKKYGITVFADVAQSIPHLSIDVKKLGADFIVFSGHKMLGPLGIGVLYGKLEMLREIDPFIVGGGTIKDVTLESVMYDEPPYKFEAGTPNVSAAVGLMEAVKYLEKVGKDNIIQHERMLLMKARKGLSEVEKIKLYPKDLKSESTGTLAFNIDGANPHIVGSVLNDFYAIAVRTGLHCAHPYHYAIGANEGTIRASFYLYNTESEIEYFIRSMSEIVKKYF
ncbi:MULTISPECIES: aminotransferase class V-fold PLP-dependent enzyme [Fervidicoccus]|uniref:cysteine desulfurase n=1 Tax=Fervidicoccus fontis (strain DSM 19380 / JCM 18336 / VKM B-2539 / Kam940) TaxID=1163730 RepID=I0A2G3_FERFK|nr:SufS family cysteine desulfurase [Fervidicoccus fontis]AFH43170.1 cysteine desulfurase, SufS subfamily [Fervidicoccus fontis Kam940]